MNAGVSVKNRINGINENITKNFKSVQDNGKTSFTYDCNAKAVFGLGERYCSINHIGRKLKSVVFEKFCEQDENAYLPLPFFHASDGHGVFVNTAYEVTFDFSRGHFSFEIDEKAEYEIEFFYGTPKEIISQFIQMTGKICLPPKWAFGVWISANRWNCQKDIEEQIDYIKKYQYPVSVVVIEAWSDEATFYAWNGCTFDAVSGNQSIDIETIKFQEPWSDPVGMIDELHREGMKLVLWQIPALKLLDEGQVSAQHDNDCQYGIDKDLVAKNNDGTPYRIPKQWFIGSMLPDFANPDTRKWWFQKRQYLLDMGVDGFKTDGGEFVHNDDTIFYGENNGEIVRNRYPAQYEEAYTEFIGRDRVLFSRAGYIGAQTTPMHWAGDQQSKFEELKSVLNAGISLSLSGVPFWSFDIAGFAGPLPSKELYLRASALGAFVPAMQWHSESAGGQFSEILKGNGGTNDRSPWNMALVENDESIISIATFFANLHMNFLPYLYSEAKKCAIDNSPLMKHLYLEYPTDENALMVDDEYMIGDLLVAPVVISGEEQRRIYLPEGNWYDLWTGNKLSGNTKVYVEVPLDKIPIFVREGTGIILNLGKEGCLGSYVGNEVTSYENVVLVIAGGNVNYEFQDDLGNYIKMVDGKMEIDTLSVTICGVGELGKDS